MQCNEVGNHFTDYVNDALAEPFRSEMQQHLIGCESCSEEVEALKGVWTTWGSILSERPDSSAMRSRFDVMLDAYQQGMDHAPSLTWWSRFNVWFGKMWPQQPVLQFGLTMALLVIGVAVGHQYRAPAPIVDKPVPAQAVELTKMRDELH